MKPDPSAVGRRARYEVAKRVGSPLLDAASLLRRTTRKKKPPHPGPFGPPLACTGALKDLMTRHYFEGRYADGAVPVAWVTSGFPVEVLRALGYHTVYPENHAALLSVSRLVPELSGPLEAEGYARDLCGYARADIGSVASGKTPVGRLPKPDLLACCTNICQTVLYWYRDLAARFRVPLVLIDTPFVYGAPQPHHLAYVRDQLGEVIDVAERVAKRRLDWGHLREVVKTAREGTELWGECLRAGTHTPSPWTGFDSFFHLAPIVTLRGSEACNAYYRTLRDELRHRVKAGIGGLVEERYRLMWDNLPVWFNVREMSTLLAEGGFNFVCTTYTNAWYEAGRRVEADDLMGSAALAYTRILLNEDLPSKLALMKRLATDYDVQGAVLHSDRSCKPYSIGQIDLKERLQRDSGIRVLLLEACHADPRAWAKEQAEARLHAFMETFG